MKYIFGTGFDETHKAIEEKDLLHHPTALHDLADRGHGTKTREEVLKERRHGKVRDKPLPFG